MGKDSRQTRQETLNQIAKRGQNERASGKHHIARHLTDAQFGRIADDAGVTDPNARTALLLKIEAAAGWFFADYRSQDRQTPSTTEKEAKAVEAAAHRLLRTLKIKETNDPHDGMPSGELRELLEWAASGEGSGEQEVRSLVAGVGRLQELATKARADAEQDKGSGEPRGEALNNFIGNLMSAYEQTNELIRLSRDRTTREPGGKILKFVRSCLNGLNENFKDKYPDLIRRDLTDEAIMMRIRKLQGLRRTEYDP